MFAVIAYTTIAIVLVVAMHYQVLTHLSETHFKRKWHARLLLPAGVLVVLFTHVLEVCVFGVAYFMIFSIGGAGEIIGDFDYQILDCVYFSFVNYTTLGYGDLIPKGHIRFISGTESLVGLVLIAWTASFTYLQMQQIVDGSGRDRTGPENPNALN